MSVLTRVETKSFKGRLFRFLVIAALVGGGTTMVYPFLLMLSGSVRSEMDSADMDLVPDYFVQDDMLARKFLETKYNYDVTMMNLLRGYEDFSFLQATLPDPLIDRRADDLDRFVRETEIPPHWWVLGGTMLYKKIASRNLSLFISRLRDRYQGDLRALGEDLGAPLPKWAHVSMRIPEWTSPRYSYEPSPFYDEYVRLMLDRPLAERAFTSPTGWFMQNVIFPAYGKGSVEGYNAAHAVHLDDYRHFVLPRRVPGPDQPVLRREWLTFIEEMLNVSFMRAEVPDERYRHFLREKYGDMAELNRRWGDTAHASFDDIRQPDERAWVPSEQRQDYLAFLKSLDPEAIHLVGPEYAWHDWLRRTYPDLEALNRAHRADYTDWAQSRIPLPELEMRFAKAHAGALRWEYATCNFRNVFNEVVLQGRPFINTVIFVGLSLILCLTLQPLAAYSLSRFHPPGTWRFILIFMATMAFPPMVGMIPQFLILRKFHLLNTFIALVLPVMVNGYLIFLLKGFFDSLPQHLYDAALIDGASEMTMFWQVTMALSKPILAVVALQTFNHAWIAFMYPLLVCSKEEMHVLAVWLYQFQQSAPTSAVFASILVTSIPTMLIFLVTQRTIMRGIAVPAEK